MKTVAGQTMKSVLRENRRLLERAEQAERERDEALAHIEALQEKQNAETCACSHDRASDVCFGHSPMMRKLERERDALAELLERARAAYAGPGQLSRLVRVGRVLNEVLAPQSLDRLKAQHQAEALEDLRAFINSDFPPAAVYYQVRNAIDLRIERLRERAQGGAE